MFLLGNFIKIVVFICKQAPEKLKCFFWRRIIIFHKYWLFCLYSWRLHSLWPFVYFCLSFISNNLNNVTSPLSNQHFWPDSRLILHHHYGIFCCWVAEVPSYETSPCNGKEPGKVVVFRLHRAKLQSNTCTWGMPGGRLEVLELTDIFTPLLNKPPTLCSFSGKEVTCIKLRTLLRFLSPLYFVIDCVN